MKAHIGVNAESRLVHNIQGMSGQVGDIAKANTLLHNQKSSRSASGEGVKPVSCDKAPVWICARALFRIEDKTAQLFTHFALSNLWLMHSN